MASSLSLVLDFASSHAQIRRRKRRGQWLRLVGGGDYDLFSEESSLSDCHL